MFACQYCGYVSKRKYDVTRHAKSKHNGEIGLSSPQSNKNQFGSGYNIDNIDEVFDIRLKENFNMLCCDSYIRILKSKILIYHSYAITFHVF